MDFIWIAALAVLWVALVEMVLGLHKLQAGKGART
jgi:hypothetical protein